MATVKRDGAPATLQPWLKRVVVAMAFLALLATCLRIISRRLNRQALWWDDWLAIWNMVWLLIIVGFVSAAITLGLGAHAESISSKDMVALVNVALVIDVLYLWSLVWSKTSVLLLYYRVFRFGYIKLGAYVIGALVIALAIVSTFLTGFLCVPLSKIWDPSLPGHCLDKTNVRIFNSASTIFTDIVILCLPVPQIWMLQLRKSEKVGLTSVFALGFFVVFAAAYRISVFLHDESDDESFSIAPDAGWTVLELSAAIVSASLPTIGPATIEAWFWLHRLGYAFTSRFQDTIANRNLCRRRRPIRGTQATELDDGTQADPGKHGGSFHRLPDLRRHSSSPAVGSPVVATASTSSENEQVIGDETDSASKVRSDEASDEVPFNVVRVRTSI